MGINHEEIADSSRLISHCAFEDVLPLISASKARFLPPRAKTVIVCLFPYYVGEYAARNVARFAMINDYHKVCGDILESLAAQLKAAFPEYEFAPFIDDSPIREVRAAYTAGLGVIGRHNMLIHEKYGSRVFIGTIITNLELTPKKHAEKSCLNCGKCINACPAGAISASGPLDRKLCRSHITQKKSALTDWEQEQIKSGGLVWGCDICADACPMNAQIAKTPIKAFYDNIVPVLTQENLEQVIGEKPYNWRGTDVLLRNIKILRT